jgi:hypothetical protein
MTISQAVWNQNKAQIYNLYYERQHPIEEVIRIMKARGFPATYV